MAGVMTAVAAAVKPDQGRAAWYAYFWSSLAPVARTGAKFIIYRILDNSMGSSVGLDLKFLREFAVGS
jgi:hypothetical protein